MIEIYLLISATITTLKLALLAMIIGLTLAISIAIIEELKIFKILLIIGKFLFLIICSLPEVLVVIFIYLGISKLLVILNNIIFNIGNINYINISPVLCGVIALALIYAASAYQIISGAFKSISKSQWESGQVLGMNNNVIFFKLILPQMWQYALPGLGNQWLVLLKDTALVSLISVNDLMFQTKNIILITNKPYKWYLLSAFIYILITLLSNLILLKINFLVNRFN
ncbi:ABC transporter permease subunit [Candidatus Palibaumannia cicadellinicola]|uniref:Arginine ABC transporter, permease protein n=1 Tax=Candidatus Palibaumannia cicadellinicola TaxID=186490 RepID=A0A0K2BKZ0_9GAMM|nr:ABC transporter permease subunit [Candidatus Baumannia cicadellinicola]AKZ65869.1 Arginine ABC transporter, permease protein [Candidatus Baumannia cicadellinicola]